MSKETFYFSHDYNARSNVKIRKLIIEHGYQGYGLYWALIEDLYQNGNALPLDYEFIAYDLRADEAIVKSIIHNFDLFKIDNAMFGSLSIQRRLDIRNAKSRKARQSAIKRWKDDTLSPTDIDPTMQTHNHAQCNAHTPAPLPKNKRNAIKDSKVKDSIVKDSKVKESVDTSVSMLEGEPPTVHQIDYQAIINFFNTQTQGAFGQVMYPISEKRKSSIRARIKEHGKDKFALMIKKASASSFLKGDGSKGFVANFDWMIRPSNFQKILEGNYDNKDKRHVAHNQSGDEELMYHIKQGIARGIQENSVEP